MSLFVLKRLARNQLGASSSLWSGHPQPHAATAAAREVPRSDCRHRPCGGGGRGNIAGSPGCWQAETVCGWSCERSSHLPMIVWVKLSSRVHCGAGPAWYCSCSAVLRVARLTEILKPSNPRQFSHNQNGRFRAAAQVLLSPLETLAMRHAPRPVAAPNMNSRNTGLLVPLRLRSVCAAPAWNSTGCPALAAVETSGNPLFKVMTLSVTILDRLWRARYPARCCSAMKEPADRF